MNVDNSDSDFEQGFESSHLAKYSVFNEMVRSREGPHGLIRSTPEQDENYIDFWNNDDGEEDDDNSADDESYNRNDALRDTASNEPSVFTQYSQNELDSPFDNDVTDNDDYLFNLSYSQDYRHSVPIPSTALSQDYSNLTVAELSQMEESLLSQSSYHEVEMKRQRKKLEKKDARSRQTPSKIKRKKATKETLERIKKYKKFKYSKQLDFSEEQDIGGSMEYLIRQQLNQPSVQRRLQRIARERMMKQDKRTKEMSSSDLQLSEVIDCGDLPGNAKMSNSSCASTSAMFSESEVDWNFLDHGYTTMPWSQAHKVPFCIYWRPIDKNYPQENGKVTMDLYDADEKRKAQKRDHLVIYDDSFDLLPSFKKKRNRASGYLLNSENYTEQTQTATSAQTHSFPLHFNQLTSDMDLHAFIRNNCRGSKYMMLLHGRNAKRLWARLVAGGASSFTTKNDNYLRNQYLQHIKEDFASDDSSSSSSRASMRYGDSDYRSHKSSSMASVIDVKDESNLLIVHEVFRLMTLVHMLPSFTYRAYFQMKISTELAYFRHLWENEFMSYLDNPTFSGKNDERSTIASTILNQAELWAFKSFLGVDGNISPGPFWASDPSRLTEPGMIKYTLDNYRYHVLPRVRRLIKAAKRVAVDESHDRVDAADVEGVQNNDESGDIGDAIGDKWHIFPKIEVIDTDLTSSEKFNSTVETSVRPESETGSNPDKCTRAVTNVTEHTPELSNSLGHLIQNIFHLDSRTKYADVIYDCRIDVRHITVTLSSFLDNLTAHRAMMYCYEGVKALTAQQRREIRSIQKNVGMWDETIKLYLTSTENLTRPAFIPYAPDETPTDSEALAQAVIARQSYIANSGGSGHYQESKHTMTLESCDSDDDSEYEENYVDEHTNSFKLNILEQKELKSIQAAAKDLSWGGKEYLLNKHLNIFARIHLTTSIAIIAEHLTPTGAEIISRPCCPENPESRTPFDLIRMLLYHLDSNGALISRPADEKSRWHARDKVIDEILVTSMEDAALITRKCIKKDPQCVDHWSWYVAISLGVVCISSGISLSKDFEKDNIAGVKREKDECYHRAKLGHFYERKIHASVAILDFLHFAQVWDCPMLHLAVSSMLEWKTAIALMHHPVSSCSDTTNECSSEVKRLHAFHAYRWALYDCSEIAIARIQDLYRSKQVTLDMFLDVLAHSVEKKSCDSFLWRRLVGTLGVVGISSKTCCIECSLGCDALHDGLHVWNRSVLKEKDEQWWWGRSRISDWQDLYFEPPQSSLLKVKPEFVVMVKDAVSCETCLDPVDCDDNQYSMTEIDAKSGMVIDPEQCKGWIWNPAHNKESIDDDLSGILTDYSLLPEHITDVLSTAQDEYITVSLSQKVLDRLSDDPFCEAVSLKIIIACHMLGVWHPFVCNSVWWLAMKLWQSKQQSNKHRHAEVYSNALYWLSLNGLKISAFLDHKYKQSLNHCINLK